MDVSWNELPDLHHCGVLESLSACFLFVREYDNWCPIEISQVGSGGKMRGISLGVTEGLSAWSTPSFLTYPPLIVPVGRAVLGRLFNVTGSTLDPYLDLSPSMLYNISSYISTTTSKGATRRSHFDTGSWYKVMDKYEF